MSMTQQLQQVERAFTAATEDAVIGRVESVRGLQVEVRLAFDAAQSDHGAFDLAVGTLLGIRSPHSLIIGVLYELKIDAAGSTTPAASANGTIDLVGEIFLDNAAPRFRRGVLNHPRLDAAVLRLETQHLMRVFGDERAGRAHLGQLHQDGSVAITADIDSLVRKHFAVIGSTGAGKSSSVVLLLHEIVAASKNLRVVLIDLHDEYGHCFGDAAYVARLENLRLPYWLFTFDEFVHIVFGENHAAQQEIALLGELIPLAKDAYSRGQPGTRNNGFRTITGEGPRYTVDSAVPYRMDDLLALIQNRMGKLENNGVALAYQRLLTRLETVRQNPRYTFIFDDAYAGTDCMAAILSLLLHLRPDDPRIMTVFQLARFPSELLDPVVSLLFRLVFEFGLWSGGTLPVLLVCEEAHRYINADRSIGFRGAREGLSRIAKEGRKYCVSMGLVTQRPSELDPTLISQCNTIFALRLTNEADQRIIRAAVHDPCDRMLGFLPALSTQEALAFGEAVPMPMRLRFRDLPAEALPLGQAELHEDGCAALADRNFVGRVVARWRGAAETKAPAADPPPASAHPVSLWPLAALA